MTGVNLRQVLIEQKGELSLDSLSNLVVREKLSEINTQSNLAQIITGVRRCGKSTLARMALKSNTFAYVNFDDERLAGISAEDLNTMLETAYMVYGDFDIILLDEIQNIEGWHLFVNRLLRNKMKVILTGSNSNLLSNEMASYLTGRYATIELLPYSFAEYLQAVNIQISTVETTKDRGLAVNSFVNYLESGGFPEVVQGENRQSYIYNLFDAIVTRDIIYRYDIRNIRTFREIAIWLTGNFATEISYNRIKKIFGLGSENTAKNYVTYLEDAWLFVMLPKFSFKKQESIRNRKIYLVDTAFASISGESSTQNTGRLLENVVMLHLLRIRMSLNYEIFYYKDNFEVDFVIYSQRSVNELIQVSVSLEDQATRNREIRALLSASNEVNCNLLTIITLTQSEVIEIEGKIINVKTVYEWLLGELLLPDN